MTPLESCGFKKQSEENLKISFGQQDKWMLDADVTIEVGRHTLTEELAELLH